MLKKILLTVSVLCLFSASLMSFNTTVPAFKKRDYEVCTEIEMSVDLLEFKDINNFKI